MLMICIVNFCEISTNDTRITISQHTYQKKKRKDMHCEISKLENSMKKENVSFTSMLVE